MKIIEITSGIHIPINNEEAAVLKKFKGDTPILKSSLSDREQLLANALVVKDILKRKTIDGKVTYIKIV